MSTTVVCKEGHQQRVGWVTVTPDGVHFRRLESVGWEAALHAMFNGGNPVTAIKAAARKEAKYNDNQTFVGGLDAIPNDGDPVEFWCPRHNEVLLTVEELREAISTGRDAKARKRR